MQDSPSRWAKLKELYEHLHIHLHLGLVGLIGVASVMLLGIVSLILAIWVLQSAPPTTVTIASGPPGSDFAAYAEKYHDILARNGITLKILPSQGSLDNLKRLADPASSVDVGFVQGGLVQSGLASSLDTQTLVSLGSLYYQPLWVFYRSRDEIGQLSGFAGHRLTIGPEGSGTRALSLELLKANGIDTQGATTLTDLDPEGGAEALREGKVDAAFMMGDSTPITILSSLMRAPGIRLMSFTQSVAYTRRISYLNRLTLPQGSIELGRNIPAKDVTLLGPTVELIARKSLHPALSDLLLEAAQEVHGKATLLQNAGEFPALLEHEFPISSEATRYYKSGKSFLYRNLPFWLASLASRILVMVLPIAAVVLPGLRLLPTLYNWRIRYRITRWYGILIGLEQKLLTHQVPGHCEDILKKLDEVEQSVSHMKVPKVFGDQFYVLRQHIKYVREQVVAIAETGSRNPLAHPPSSTLNFGAHQSLSL
jgi:hypothetical protein